MRNGELRRGSDKVRGLFALIESALASDFAINGVFRLKTKDSTQIRGVRFTRSPLPAVLKSWDFAAGLSLAKS